jgi:hypothetical protein
MRRILVVGALVTVGVLVARARMPKLQERLIARCEAMFGRMPDTFPPKKMMRSVDEIGVTTTRILELLESRTDDAAPEISDPSTEAVHHAA